MTTPIDGLVAAPGHNVNAGIVAAQVAHKAQQTQPALLLNRFNAGLTPATGVDTRVPVGHTIQFDAATYSKATTAITATCTLKNAEVGCTFAITFTSSGGGTPVVKTGTVTRRSVNEPRRDFQVTGCDFHTLTAGNLQASVVLTDVATNASVAKTAASVLTA